MTRISYKRHRFPSAVIQHAVWLYVRFTLSLRDVEEMLAHRGVDVSYETIRAWTVKFGPKIIEVATFRRQVPAGTEEEPTAAVPVPLPSRDATDEADAPDDATGAGSGVDAAGPPAAVKAATAADGSFRPGGAGSCVAERAGAAAASAGPLVEEGAFADGEVCG